MIGIGQEVLDLNRCVDACAFYLTMDGSHPIAL